MPVEPLGVRRVPVEQLARRLRLAERDQRLDLVGDDARGARLGDLLGAEEVDEWAERAADLGRPADGLLQQAERRPGEVLRRAAVGASGDRERALGAVPAVIDVPADRVGERAQREQVGAHRGLAGLLRQRMALVRVTDRAPHVPRTQSIWAPNTST